ncbi:hypothetical protein FB451DRAFT_557121 [Mycena latifolia]|nr:hypothetical protein FB451DRAFT_557121 [Mycena latifolia]
MTAVLNRQFYNSLTSLGEAHSAVVANETAIMAAIDGPVHDIFLKYSVQDVLSLYLQHRHHTVGEGEAVVKVEGTAHLMDAHTVGQVTKVGNAIVPTTWMIIEGQTYPMEFSVVKAFEAQNNVNPPQEFVKELAGVLLKAGCENLFGLDSVCADDWVEMSIGDASVVVPCTPGQAEAASDDYIPVSFVFDRNNTKARVHGKCGPGAHKHTSKPKPAPPK